MTKKEAAEAAVKEMMEASEKVDAALTVATKAEFDLQTALNKLQMARERAEKAIKESKE